MRHLLPFGLRVLASLLFALAAPALALADTPQKITLEMNEFSFVPSTFTVTQGQPVQFTVHNGGKFPHNVAFELASKSIKQTVFTANVKVGETQTAEFTFSDAGQWRMYCPVDGHADKGMVGTVVVLAPGASALPQAGGGGLALLTRLGGAVLVGALVLGAILLARPLAFRRR